MSHYNPEKYTWRDMWCLKRSLEVDKDIDKRTIRGHEGEIAEQLYCECQIED